MNYVKIFKKTHHRVEFERINEIELIEVSKNFWRWWHHDDDIWESLKTISQNNSFLQSLRCYFWRWILNDCFQAFFSNMSLSNVSQQCLSNMSLSNVSENRRRQAFSEVFLGMLITFILKDCSQAIFSNNCSQRIVLKSHYERLFFDVILRDEFWMTVANDVSQNRRYQCSQKCCQIFIISIILKYHSQAIFSNSYCQQSFSSIVFWDVFWRVILNDCCQWCLSEPSASGVFRSVSRCSSHVHSQASFSSNLLNELFLRVILRDCFLMWFLEMNFE